MFADGARHRIDIAKVSSNKECVTTSFYNAPYYRSNSTSILSADFNNCSTPPGWKDTLLAKAVPSQPNAQWLISDKNSFTINTFRGNFDSTCMLSYNRSNSFGQMYSGAVSLTSPSVDASSFKDIKLHFDYNFLAYKTLNSKVTPSVSLDVYDGSHWVNVFKRSADISYPNVPNPRRNVWDSIPGRVFIDLESYKNKKFQLRLLADDASLTSDSSGYLFAAFDNIQVDGYGAAVLSDDIVVFPNPTKTELFIQFFQQPSTVLNYRLVDISGRIVNNGLLNNYRIDLSRVNSGMYLLILYENGKILATKKILKQ